MVQAVFCDFYGTLVHEDGEVINAICQEIMRTGRAENTRQNRRVLVGYLSRGLPPVLWRRLPDPAAAGTDFPGPDDPCLSLLRRLQRLEPAPVRALAVSPCLRGLRRFSCQVPGAGLHRLQHRPRGHLGRDPASQFFRSRRVHQRGREILQTPARIVPARPGGNGPRPWRSHPHWRLPLQRCRRRRAAGDLRLVAESKQPACPRRGPLHFFSCGSSPNPSRAIKRRMPFPNLVCQDWMTLCQRPSVRQNTLSLAVRCFCGVSLPPFLTTNTTA